jgi:hypothetical protein
MEGTCISGTVKIIFFVEMAHPVVQLDIVHVYVVPNYEGTCFKPVSDKINVHVSC